MDLRPLDAPIDTPRLTLRLLDASDLDGLASVHGDDAVTRFLPSTTWLSPEDGQAWLARHQVLHDEGVVRRWAIVEKETARRLGDCMLFRFDDVSSRAELGFVLGRRDWGRGIMREAVEAVIDAGFGALGLRRIEAFADPRNVASHRLLLALGFVHEGLLRQRVVIKGEVKDSNVYGLLKDAWAMRDATARH